MLSRPMGCSGGRGAGAARDAIGVLALKAKPPSAVASQELREP